MTRLPLSLLVCLGVASGARAMPPPCTQPGVETVLVSDARGSSGPSLDDVVQHLGAGLEQVAVCTGALPTQRVVARVQLALMAPHDLRLQIRVADTLTAKTLTRSIALSSLPEDSRAVALALYIEELLQASWAELALGQRLYLREYPPPASSAVKQELETVLPTPAPEHALHLRGSLGASLTGFHDGVRAAGLSASFAVDLLPWLEVSLRLGYQRTAPVPSEHGTIRADLLSGGAGLDFAWALAPRLSVRFPQGLELARVAFSASPTAEAEASRGSQLAVVVSHGAGLRVGLLARLSTTFVARLCWTAISARASDESFVTGVSGLGGAADLTLDAHF